MIPAGRFFSGSLTSPPMAATFVTPAYATKTNAAVSANVQTWVLNAPSRGMLASKSGENKAAMQIMRRRMTVIITIGV